MSSTPRTAIVTGAARGIGAATAKRLAADGRKVGVLDLDAAACADTVAAITDAGGQAIGVGVDVANPDQVAAAVAQVDEALGSPTILVNNAGITRDNLLFKMTVEDWDAVMNVHLRGAFLMTKAVQALHDAGELRPHRQPVVGLGARQPRSGQLRGGQGRHAGLHQDPGHRAGQVRGHGQRDRARASSRPR